MASYIWERQELELEDNLDEDSEFDKDRQEEIPEELVSDCYEKQSWFLTLFQRKDYEGKYEVQLPEEVMKLPFMSAPNNSIIAVHTLEANVFNPVPREKVDIVSWCGISFTRDSARYKGLVDATLEIRYYDGWDGGRRAFAYFFQGQFKEGDTVLIPYSKRATIPEPELDEELVHKLEELGRESVWLLKESLRQKAIENSKPYRYELKYFRGDLTRYFGKNCGDGMEKLPPFGLYIGNFFSNSNLPEDVKNRFKKL